MEPATKSELQSLSLSEDMYEDSPMETFHWKAVQKTQ